MMFSLTRPHGDTVTFKGREYRLKLYFDRVLEMQKLLSDDSPLPEDESALAALYLICDGAERLSPSDASELLETILREHILSEESDDDGSPPVFDFEQDAEYIYSSFMMDYGIDLHKELGRLHWKDFISLFKGLSEGTKMREVISIRSREIPEPTKYNRREIEAIIRLKQFYALRLPDNRKNNFVSGLAEFAEMMKANATVKGGDSNERK